MNAVTLSIATARLDPRPSGALWWPSERLLCVSDLHLGKSERIARRGGPLLPPYETGDTLARLEADLAATGARIVVCLGDSFDDLDAARSLDDADRLWLSRMQAGRRWIWIEGNHDPGPVEMGGTHLTEFRLGPLTFRHIARPGAAAEISGHYHPKADISARGRRVVRPCILCDGNRAILPAYGTYTGGLSWTSPVFAPLLGPCAQAVLLGDPLVSLPVPPPSRAVVLAQRSTAATAP